MAACWVSAQDLPEVSSLSPDLVAEVDVAWTNDSLAKTALPSMGYNISVGLVAYDGGFSTGVIAQLVGTTITGTGSQSVVVYDITVEEETSSRMRIYYNATNAAFHTSTSFAVSGYPTNWIEEVYGDPPSYLSGTNLTAWYVARDPERAKVQLSLISTGDVSDYLDITTNAIATSTNDLLALYSNDLAVVGFSDQSDDKHLYIHGPTNIVLIDLFRSEDLLIDPGWSHLGVVSHAADPIWYIDTSAPTQTAHYAAGDALEDEDNDGLASGREKLLYGTDETDSDTDDDGLADNLELLVYGTDPNDTDSDDDGLTDGQEHLSGYDPTSDDTDGDGLDDGYEVATRTDPLNPDTTIPIVYVSIPTNNAELVVTP